LQDVKQDLGLSFDILWRFFEKMACFFEKKEYNEGIKIGILKEDST